MNKVFGGIVIYSIKLMLSILALGMLVAVGAAVDGMDGFGASPHDGSDGFGGHDGHDGPDGHGDRHDFDAHKYHDWLNPGGISYVYSWGYPSYHYTYWYPTYTYPSYTYTYPTYYTAPAVYPTYTYYYDPIVYDPWYATNVYGWSGVSYSYSTRWSWSTHGGYFF
ncbi:MAG: hypothetical protein A4E49_01119 [Methanosaeta sp. PtaU1.Bin112]|nr:MAG: hypothetical protein A4E49_01119 [Methanosaeta sp. PtaU1.Bin112]